MKNNSIVFLLFSFSSLSACSWCNEWRKAEVKSSVVEEKPEINQEEAPSLEKEKEDFVASFFANLAAQPIEEPKQIEENKAEDIQVLQAQMAEIFQNIQNIFSGENVPEELTAAFQEKPSAEIVPAPQSSLSLREIKAKTEVVGQKFYKAYLSRFYPKALVIRDYFFDMCPIAAIGAFSEFVKMLTDETWFVFKNKPEHYKNSEHWEIIIEECKNLDMTLAKAYVDIKSNKVINGETVEPAQRRKLVPIKEYWTQNGITSFLDFYAYYADYIKRMFNEGIIFEDLMQSYRYAKNYNDVLKNIPESMFDGVYHEHQKINKELLAELRKKHGMDSLFDPYDDLFMNPMGAFPFDGDNQPNEGIF